MIICFIVYIYEILKIFLKIKKNERHEGNESRTIFPFFSFHFCKNQLSVDHLLLGTPCV